MNCIICNKEFMHIRLKKVTCGRKCQMRHYYNKNKKRLNAHMKTYRRMHRPKVAQHLRAYDKKRKRVKA